jgi:hypothetical protein
MREQAGIPIRPKEQEKVKEVKGPVPIGMRPNLQDPKFPKPGKVPEEPDVELP